MNIRNLLFATLIASACAERPVPNFRERLDLAGVWQFALDTAGTGIQEGWFEQELRDEINLPGTTDSNKKGFLNTDTTTLHLNRAYKYDGKAWYRREVLVPEDFRNKRIVLHLERAKTSEVWVDSSKVGSSRLLQSPQVFDLSEFLTPGKHTITIQINNDLKLTPYGNVHIYSDDTQTNWNGILGEMYLEAMSATYISNLQVFPDVDEKKIDIELEAENVLSNEIEVELWVRKFKGGKVGNLPVKKIKVSVSELSRLEYDLGEASENWDEFSQPLYELTAVISGSENKDSKTVPFGMRKFQANGTQFEINGRKVFLRGKHESAVFPLTGHAPMDIESWRRVYKIAKSYGINHYRFHSYCPPEAAFAAADQEGIYLQAELPFWGGLESDTVAMAQREEGFAMLKAYANHPSFVMMSHGNEIWSGHDLVEANISALKEYDNRPLYAMGSNNNIGYVLPRKVADFHVAARTPSDGDTTQTHLRLTHAFVDSRDGGTLNTQIPSTSINFDYPVSQVQVPMVTHEIAQYQIYPNYDEIDKYSGPVKAWNLEVFKTRLEKSGMGEMDSLFQMASGAWSALCYKAEMEAALRTGGLAGFQLLDLQDFPGQGTALVGILDAFMDDKGVVDRQTWLQSCNEVVILTEFDKYVWTNDEEFTTNLKIANYSFSKVTTRLMWSLVDEDGKTIDRGEIGVKVANNGLSDAGRVTIDLSKIADPQKLSFELRLESTDYSNSYPLWVYPDIPDESSMEDILVLNQLDKATLAELRAGAKALLLPKTKDIKESSVAGLFPPDFWNYGMFKGISEWAKKPVSPGTLGLLMDPEHPIFNSFPTDFHTNWHWFSIIKASNSMILDETPNEYRPIVQVIDNLERNHKMGMIFEFKIGKGKLLVCTSRLNEINDKPEARHLLQSIVTYAKSNAFDPQFEINEKLLIQLMP